MLGKSLGTNVLAASNPTSRDTLSAVRKRLNQAGLIVLHIPYFWIDEKGAHLVDRKRQQQRLQLIDALVTGIKPSLVALGWQDSSGRTWFRLCGMAYELRTMPLAAAGPAGIALGEVNESRACAAAFRHSKDKP